MICSPLWQFLVICTSLKSKLSIAGCFTASEFVCTTEQRGPHKQRIWVPHLTLQFVLGSTVVSPYVGMARKQNGGYNASISVQTLLFHLVVNSTRLKTVRSALWRCPNSTVALRLLENVVKVTNLEVVNIEFRHLPILLSSSASLAP